jgi:hypothetical protein
MISRHPRIDIQGTYKPKSRASAEAASKVYTSWKYQDAMRHVRLDGKEGGRYGANSLKPTIQRGNLLVYALDLF